MASRVTLINAPGVATNVFTYNGLDARVSRTDSTGTRTYRRSGADPTSPVLNDGVAAYTPGISENWSGVGTRHFLTDYLGSVGRTTSVQQNVLNTRTYDAYGNTQTFTGTYAAPFGYAGAWGYQEDRDTNLKLLGHRYYDSSTGRFLTRDPIKDGRNWYAYAGNNPTGAVDPNGLIRRPLTDEEDKGLLAAIIMLSERGYSSEACSLMCLRRRGKIWIDDEMGADGLTGMGMIYINPKFFQRIGTGGQGKRGWLLAIDDNIVSDILLSSVLLHEHLHTTQLPPVVGATDAFENQAWSKQMNYVRDWRIRPEWRGRKLTERQRQRLGSELKDFEETSAVYRRIKVG